MKRIAILLGLTLVLSGCGSKEEELSTNKENKSFIIVSSGDETKIEYKHIKTGCHYVESAFNSDYFTQMFIEKNGVSVPYCD
jgi:PBP1b-binding outer membrane lipoprotein LpoB